MQGFVTIITLHLPWARDTLGLGLLPVLGGGPWSMPVPFHLL